jgi:hypothetical protein
MVTFAMYVLLIVALLHVFTHVNLYMYNKVHIFKLDVRIY